MTKKLLILNGPNLNMLGKRQPEIYGSETLNALEQKISERAQKLKLEVTCFQSNSESDLIDRIQKASENTDWIIINPAAYTHTSIAIRDALLATGIPVLEVHISNIHTREEFRRKSFVSGIAKGVIAGLGTQGYLAALEYIASLS